ncbi:O-antigen ligase family protein [Hyphomicrobium denitrificans]|nr:O-antigen ligase family protein [Hyphomicrobium denitrificans]
MHSGVNRDVRRAPRLSIGRTVRTLIHAPRGHFYLTAGVFGLSIVFGGGTRSGFLGDAVLQLISLPLLWTAISELLDCQEPSRLRRLLPYIAAVASLPLLQLVPLPPSIWTSLPGRAVIVETYGVLGYPLPAHPLTLSPTATWLSTLGLVPPIAIFLGMATLDYEERRVLSLVLIAMAVISVFLGLLQLAGGANSALRFYVVTNTTEAVGFFANRNHFAVLLYAAMLFSFCWLLDAAVSVASKARRARLDSKPVIYFAGGAVAFIALLAGQLMARSRAGLILSAVALMAGFAMAMRDRRARNGSHLSKVLLGTIAITIAICSQFAFFRILDRFGPDIVSDVRIAIVRNTIAAARAYMPFGSGLGTFVPVYQMFEKPADIAVTYVNHAHNDFLELWLETGILGLALLILCIVWLVRRAIAVWATDDTGDDFRIDRNLMRSAAIVAALLLVHSLVDYPLRTTADLSVFAFAAGLLVSPLEKFSACSGGDVQKRQAKKSTFAQGVSRRHKPARQRELWDGGGDWPAEWRDKRVRAETEYGAHGGDVRFTELDDKK